MEPQLRELISTQAIRRRVTALGQEISTKIPPGDLTVVGVLRGAFVFMADLVRAIPRETRCDFLRVQSYGDALVSSGAVGITSDLMLPVEGQHVLLVEDIVDSGLTIRFLHEHLRTRRPKTLHTCALLSKAAPDMDRPLVDFVGFEAPDKFVVGYGLDAAQKYRNLPYIATLD